MLNPKLRNATLTGGGLYSMDPYIHWDKGTREVVLDGNFSREDLELILDRMRGKKIPELALLPVRSGVR